MTRCTFGLAVAAAGLWLGGVVVAAEAPVPLPPEAALALIGEADAARQLGELDRAAALYADAVRLDPANQQAQQGLAATQATRTGRGEPARSDLAADAAVQREALLAEARVASERAELQARAGQAEAARESLALARNRLAAAGAEPGDLLRIERLIDELTPTVGRESESTAASQRAQALVDAAEASESAAAHEHGVLAERLARIRDLQSRHLFELALATTRELLREMPGEASAQQLFDELLAQVHDQRRADLDEQGRELRHRVMERLGDALLPRGFDGEVAYPPDWDERQRRAGRNSAEESAMFEPWQERLIDRLATRVTLDFDSMPLDEALAFLAKQGGFNLVVDPAVYANGAQPVTLRVTDMTVEAVLNWLARMAGTRWDMVQGAIFFGDAGIPEQVLAVYDLAYLLRPPYDQPGYTLGFQSGGGNGQVFTEPEAPPERLAPEDLVDLIRIAVAPGTWTPEGANQIDIHGNGIYVTAPRTVHALLREFVRSQGRERSLAVRVAARWVTVNDQALEEIGVNWGSQAQLLSPGGVPGTTPGYQHQTSGAYQTANAINRLPDTAITVVPPTAGSGLNLSWMHLAPHQVSAVFTAVERKSDSRIAASPDITTLNGVRGNVFFGMQAAYIQDYAVVNNNLDPVIDVLTVGASLDVKPYISADRKYVSLEFRPIVANVSFFTELISAPRIIDGGGQDNVVVIPGLAFPLELPNVSVQEASTTVLVPDHGSLMVGGFGNTLTARTSAGVPVLSHIPFLGRLFGSRGRYDVRAKLYLLATVHIIDYQEAEENL